MCQALRHHLYGPGILAGSELPQTVHNILYAGIVSPTGGLRFVERDSVDLRLGACMEVRAEKTAQVLEIAFNLMGGIDGIVIGGLRYS